MQLKKLTFLGVGVAVIILPLFLNSCTPKVTEEQLAKLQELRKQERTLTDELDKKKKEKPGLEAELRSRMSELNDCTSRKDYIKQKLDKWPDVWPDYKPEPPAQPEAK